MHCDSLLPCFVSSGVEGRLQRLYKLSRLVALCTGSTAGFYTAEGRRHEDSAAASYNLGQAEMLAGRGGEPPNAVSQPQQGPSLLSFFQSLTTRRAWGVWR